MYFFWKTIAQALYFWRDKFNLAIFAYYTRSSTKLVTLCLTCLKLQV
jgi:hypothetical protein